MGDLLIRAKLVTEQDVQKALQRLSLCGGRLGENLVAIGAITNEQLEKFLHRTPREPENIPATGLDEVDLLSLLLKLMYVNRLQTVRQFADAIKLPYNIVLELTRMAVDRLYLQNLGARQGDSLIDMVYQFTDEGRRYVIDAMNRLHYVGPAPVTLEEFNQQVNMQKLTNELVTPEKIKAATTGLAFDERIIEQAGPALNSGRAMLLYGPPGNGKTTVAQRFASVFSDVIYVPYAVMVEGQIIRVHDPSIHLPLESAEIEDENTFSVVRTQTYDARWVPCQRPFVITGGELTLEMLDLRYDPTGHYYEAPLHMKALGGTFLIDDFGRQIVSPTNLLNRWIVPLEGKVDYLKLHTGKTFSIPFEELVIFSTNLEPEDLMDPAFLRRLPYKIEVGPPSVLHYARIFEGECQKQKIEMSEEIFDIIVHKITVEKQLELAAYHPRFIVDQVMSTCRFMREPPHFEPRFIDYAIDNLRVKQSTSKKVTQARV
ncbi:ATPase [Occallatibacter savannae]|uniref:ATPase n=1 Tax=Occallatibacter savannae TaxID=1002691 RepID=UPI0013A5428C|nr:ATPase [Occallatibacter savannae]